MVTASPSRRTRESAPAPAPEPTLRQKIKATYAADTGLQEATLHLAQLREQESRYLNELQSLPKAEDPHCHVSSRAHLQAVREKIGPAMAAERSATLAVQAKVRPMVAEARDEAAAKFVESARTLLDNIDALYELSQLQAQFRLTGSIKGTPDAERLVGTIAPQLRNIVSKYSS